MFTQRRVAKGGRYAFLALPQRQMAALVSILRCLGRCAHELSELLGWQSLCAHQSYVFDKREGNRLVLQMLKTRSSLGFPPLGCDRKSNWMTGPGSHSLMAGLLSGDTADICSVELLCNAEYTLTMLMHVSLHVHENG